MLRIGARGIQFIGGNVLCLIEAFDDGHIVFDLKSEDIYDDRAGRIMPERWKLFGNKAFDAEILQADGVDHSGGGLNEARRRITQHGFAGNALRYEAPDAAQRNDVLELDAVAEGTAGGDDWIDQIEAGEHDAHVRLHWQFLREWQRSGCSESASEAITGAAPVMAESIVPAVGASRDSTVWLAALRSAARRWCVRTPTAAECVERVLRSSARFANRASELQRGDG